ncbi:myeloid leukemia factor [Musca vetustissima]|uniref:myeloid leukemia factor n=1 Tax=Musca vetustissima TaxID=27455 RepID=UPI002AB695DF|nr:myeloid leukemia factor [Musca vetustissima]
MSLFGSLMGDFDDDIFGSHMNAMNMQMRSMNRLMNSLMPDPFNMLTPFDPGFQQNALMERQNGPAMGGLFGFPAMGPMMMPNMNRLLSADIGNNGGASFCSSSVITMSSGPDGRPQIYQATSSTKTGPGGIRETRRTVQDSVNGVKKMAIGHHIGERAHIIEKEQDIRSGQLEERQEFINLDEDEAEDFDREFTTKASGGRMGGGHRAIGGIPGVVPPHQQTLTIEPLDDDDDDEVIETTGAAAPHISHPHQRPSSSSSGSHQRRYLPALPAPPQQPPSSHQNSSNSSSTTTTTTTNESRQSTDNATTSYNKSRIDTTAGRHGAATSTNNISNTSSSSSSPSPYISTTPRRLSAYRSGSSHIGGVSPRRPLRTPPSSPLATTPTMHNHSTTSSPSVHPHPYNTTAARRSHHHHHNHHHHHHHHRSKQHGGGNKHSTTSNSPGAAAAATTSNSNKTSSSADHKEESNN